MHFSRLVSCLGFLVLPSCGLSDLPAGQNFAAGTGGKGPAAGTGGAGGSSSSTSQAAGGGAGSTSSSAATTGGGAGSATSAGGAAGDTTGGAGGAAGSSAEDASTPDVFVVDTGSPEVASDANVGCAGHALELDGIGYLQVARMVQDDFTLEAWIKTTTSYTGTNFYEGNGLIYADVGGTANDFGSSILSGKFAFGVGNPDTTIISTTTVTNGQWVHVAATRLKSTGEIQVFVNGQLESSKIVAQTASLTAQSLMTIGANSIDGKYFNGVIDEVRIWNIVRSQADIAATLHKTLTGNEPGLVAYYRLDESSGASAADSSPSHADAAVSGEGTFVVSDAPTCP
jgi:hypothetical protein